MQIATLPEPAWVSALTATIADLLPRTAIPGAIVGVWQDGQSPYVQAFGVQDPATGEPMTPDLVPDNSILREFVGGSILRDFHVAL